MGYITLSVLGFSLLALLFGAFVGMLRGRNRAVLRLALMLICVLLAVFLRETVADVILGLETTENGVTMTLRESILQELIKSLGDGNMDAFVDFGMALVDILVGLACFYLLFIVLRLITWLIVFPICKIFVKRGEKRRRGLGALAGLLQGALIAFVICAPATGLLISADRLMKVEVDGKPAVEELKIPEELDLEEYLGSLPAGIYDSTGAWFFKLLTTTKDASGNVVSIDDTCTILESMTKLADSLTSVNDRIDDLTAEGATTEDRLSALKDIGSALVEAGNSIDGLSSDAQKLTEELLSTVATTMGGENGESSPEIEEILSDFSFEELDLVAAGNAMTGIASYIEKTDESLGSLETVTQKEVDDIVNGIAANGFILDLLTSEGEAPTLIEVDGENADLFENAISDSSLSAEDKDVLRTIFGLN